MRTIPSTCFSREEQRKPKYLLIDDLSSWAFGSKPGPLLYKEHEDAPTCRSRILLRWMTDNAIKLTSDSFIRCILRVENRLSTISPAGLWLLNLIVAWAHPGVRGMSLGLRSDQSSIRDAL